MTTTPIRYAGDSIRKRAPHVLAVYQETRATVLESGIVERELKELCARYLAQDEEVAAALDAPDGYDERQRAALAWADSIAWRSEDADDALWERLHRAFTEPELVELGYSVAIMLGQQHWLAAHGIVELPGRSRERQCDHIGDTGGCLVCHVSLMCTVFTRLSLRTSSTTFTDHYSMLRATQEMMMNLTPLLGSAATAADMRPLGL